MVVFPKLHLNHIHVNYITTVLHFPICATTGEHMRDVYLMPLPLPCKTGTPPPPSVWLLCHLLYDRIMCMSV